MASLSTLKNVIISTLLLSSTWLTTLQRVEAPPPAFRFPLAQGADIDDLESRIHRAVSSMDAPKAISVALSSFEFQSIARSHGALFSSIYTTWSVSSEGRSSFLVWNDVNVVFSFEGKGDFTNIVASVDPHLTTVTGVEIREAPIYATVCGGPIRTKGPAIFQPECGGGGGGSTGCSPGVRFSDTWSGYEMSTACSNISVPLRATATWTVPAVGEPWPNACEYHNCNVAINTGLASGPGGVPGFVHAGTVSKVWCGLSICTYFHDAWYEFIAQGYAPTVGHCGALYQGDFIRADVINAAFHGGGINYYDVYVARYPQGPSGQPTYVCAVVNYGFNAGQPPKLAEFILERPFVTDDICICAYFARLPQFGPITMSATINEGGQPSLSGYEAWRDGEYTIVRMNNGNSGDCSTCNIALSTFATSSSFTQTWVTSNGT